MRQEKGLPKIEADWADKCPANPQFVQMYQSAQMDDGGDMEDPDAAEDDNGEDNDAWNDVNGGNDSEGQDETDEGSEEKPLDFGSGNTDEGVNKSLTYWI